jgi:hypothetical protein
MLLFGRLPKMEYGILDKTHLQFYTRDTARQMLRKAGLRIEHESGTCVPLGTIWHNAAPPVLETAMRVQHGMVKMLPRLFAMQFIFEARRNSNINS